MKIFLAIFLNSMLFCSCAKTQSVIQPLQVSAETPSISETKIKPNPIKKNVEEKLQKYLSKREIKPSVVINNDYAGADVEREEVINVSKHKVTWIYSYKETKIKINDDIFSLKNTSSLNKADDDEKIDSNIVNSWDEIKLFKVNNRELIGITMNRDFCTGLMCSVNFYLIYDLKTKSKTFFGNFRTDNELKLYDFRNDGSIDFLSTTNVGFSYTSGIEYSHIYEIYTLDDKGNFNLQYDKQQKSYFIKRVFSSDEEKEIDEKFEQNWIEEIK